MKTSSTLATFAVAATLAALPAAAAAQQHGSPRRSEGAAAPAAAAGASAQRVVIEVTGEGFVPTRVPVKVGRPVTLVVTRKTDRTCATDIVVKEYGVSKPLPLGQAVEVTFTPTKAGPIRYACAMDMIAGVLVAQ